MQSEELVTQYIVAARGVLGNLDRERVDEAVLDLFNVPVDLGGGPNL